MSTAEELLFGVNNEKPMFDDRKQIKSWIQNRLIPLGILLVIERSDDSKIVFKCKSYRYSSSFKKIRQKRISKKQKLLWKEKGLSNLEERLKKHRTNQNNNNETCTFRIRANFSVRINKWSIVIVNNEHNHPLRNCLNEKGETFNDKSFTKDISDSLEKNRFLSNPKEPEMISSEHYEELYERKPRVVSSPGSKRSSPSLEPAIKEQINFDNAINENHSEIDTNNGGIFNSPYFSPGSSSPPAPQINSNFNNKNTLNNSNNCNNCANCDCDMSSYESLSPPRTSFFTDYQEFDSLATEITAAGEYQKHQQEMIDINRLLAENNNMQSFKFDSSTISNLSLDSASNSRYTQTLSTVSNSIHSSFLKKDIHPEIDLHDSVLKIDNSSNIPAPSASDHSSSLNNAPSTKQNFSDIMINDITLADILSSNIDYNTYEGF